MIHKMYFVGITGTVLATGKAETIAFALASTRKTHKPFILYVGDNPNNRQNHYKVLVMAPIATTRKIDSAVARVTDWLCWLNGTNGTNGVIREILANRTTVPV